MVRLEKSEYRGPIPMIDNMVRLEKSVSTLNIERVNSLVRLEKYVSTLDVFVGLFVWSDLRRVSTENLLAIARVCNLVILYRSEYIGHISRINNLVRLEVCVH